MTKINKQDTISGLIALSAVAHAGTVSGAAEYCSMERPTLKKKLEKLAVLMNDGRELFNVKKGTKGDILTPDGRRLWSRIEPYLHDIEEALTGIEAVNDVDYDPEVIDDFISHEHSVRLLEAGNCVPLIKHAWRAWRDGGYFLDGTSMAALKSWLVVFQRRETGWEMFEVGERSSYATWYGEEVARNAIARVHENGRIPGTFEFNSWSPFAAVLDRCQPRYDHIQANIRRNGKKEWVSMQRLAVPVRRADGTWVVASVVARTNQIEILSLAARDRHLLAECDVMDDDPFSKGLL